MRVWVDFTNTAHVPVLRPLVELLEADGHEVELTARPLSHTLELLDDWGHPYRVIGRHGGARRVGKALAAAGRVRGLLRFARDRKFDFALGPRLGRPAAGRAAAADPERDDVRLRVGDAPSTTSSAGSRTACSSRTRSRPSGWSATEPGRRSSSVRGAEGGVLPLGLGAGSRRC